MNNTLRNVIAVVLGVIAGSCINMALITLSPSLIPHPAGVDVNDPRSLAKAMALFEPRHFFMPFLAHAVGTFVGALVAYLIAGSHKQSWAYTIGVVFFAGGVMACFMIPAPVWFMALDILLAYLPMAWLGIRVGQRLNPG